MTTADKPMPWRPPCTSTASSGSCLRPHPPTQLANSMATLMQRPVIKGHSGALKSVFDAPNNLFEATLLVAMGMAENKGTFLRFHLQQEPGAVGHHGPTSQPPSTGP